MKLCNENAVVFFPDGNENLSRTTHLAISAHHDDIELMAMHGVLECFGKKDKWFTGVVVTDGAGSPRNGLYADYTDEEMKAVRVVEQKKAAFVGEYAAQLMLGYTSAAVKDGKNDKVVEDLMRVIEETRPEIIYTHNPADKHDTHCAVVLRVIEAIRRLPKELRPKKLYGCEVWRDLDWVVDEEKTVFDVSAHPNVSAALISVFDSQICGGKRYDLAAQSRRVANATYYASHGVDDSNALNYGVDMTELIADKTDETPFEFIARYIDGFRADVENRVKKLSK